MAISFGALDVGSTQATALAAAGCTRAMLEWKWRDYEPSEGSFPIGANQLNKYTIFRNAGLDVVLSMGLHYKPNWIATNANTPNFVNQSGTVSSAPNIVFSADVRSKVVDYLTRINQDFASAGGLNAFSQIRISTGANSFGELMYPQEGGYSYWAFDNAALTGQGLADGQTVNPNPSWIPGTADASVDKAAWADWYITSMTNTAKFLMDTMNGLGFTGTYALLMPGSGVRPSSYTSAIAANLPAGNLLGTGAVWELVVKKLSALSYASRIGIHCSSVGDNSGGNDYTLPSDYPTYGNTPTATAMNSWSAARWMTFLSNVYGLKMGGENTGYPGSDAFNAYYKNTSRAGIMNKSLQQAKNGDWDWFDWAHSSHLFDNVQYLANYKTLIAEANSTGSGTGMYYHLAANNQWKRVGT